MPRMLPILPQAKPESCRAEGDQGGRAVADRSPQRRETDANDGPVVPATVKFELPRDDASHRLEQPNNRPRRRRSFESRTLSLAAARFIVRFDPDLSVCGAPILGFSLDRQSPR